MVQQAVEQGIRDASGLSKTSAHFDKPRLLVRIIALRRAHGNRSR